MSQDELTSRMFKLRADLTATNLLLEAMCATLPLEQHTYLLDAWRRLRVAQAEALVEGGVSIETRNAMDVAAERMEQRLIHAPESLARS